MEYTSKYKAEEIEAILDAKNNTGEAVDEKLDGLFVDALQTKEVELSESAEITPDEGFLGLKKVTVTVKGGGSGGVDEYWKIDESKVEDGESMYYMMILAYSSRVKLQGQIVPSGSIVLAASGVSGCKFSQLVDIASAASITSLREFAEMYASRYPDILAFFDKVFTPSTEEQFYTI